MKRIILAISLILISATGQAAIPGQQLRQLEQIKSGTTSQQLSGGRINITKFLPPKTKATQQATQDAIQAQKTALTLPPSDMKFSAQRKIIENYLARINRGTSASTRRKLRIQAGARLPGVVDRQGNTMLHAAVREQDASLLNSMLTLFMPVLDALNKQRPKLGIPTATTFVNQQNRDGQTALHLAAASGQDGLASALLKAGGDQKIKDKRGTVAADLVPQDKQEAFAPLFKPSSTQSKKLEYQQAAVPGVVSDVTTILAKPAPDQKPLEYQQGGIPDVVSDVTTLLR